MGIIIGVVVLAIISRKNFSKYKDKPGVFGGIGLLLTGLIPPGYKGRLRSYIRRVSVKGDNRLSIEADRFMSTVIAGCVKYVFWAAVIFTVISYIPEEEDSGAIVRPGYGESQTYVELEMSQGDTSESYTLVVYPMEYTTDRFNELADAAQLYIDKMYLGDNPDAEHVTDNLQLVTKDETGTLTIKWESDDPLAVASDGKVSAVETETEVTLTARIKDENNERTYTEKVTVLPVQAELTDSDRAKVEILDIEESNRSEEELVLPEAVGDVEIRRADKSSNRTGVFMLIIVTIVLIGVYRVYGLRKKAEEQDEVLRGEYFGFANRLTLLLGAGMSMQEALRTISRGLAAGPLKDEIDYTLNMIASGTSEGAAYMDMGRNIGLQEYTKLMSLIVQNLHHGNSNLIQLLEQEVKSSYYINRENIRKRGEQASEKLMLPTGLLLIVVIGIIMYPALLGI